MLPHNSNLISQRSQSSVSCLKEIILIHIVFGINLFFFELSPYGYEGFTTTESVTAGKIVSFLDIFSLSVSKDTFIVLDNATTAIIKYGS
jgi:hypothetical protein